MKQLQHNLRLTSQKDFTYKKQETVVLATVSY